MHDFSLGPPVNVGKVEGALHEGECFDGVYGCHRCHNAENDGKGHIMPCDWCRKAAPTRSVRPWDESGQVMYMICRDCRKKYDDDLQREYEYERQKNGYDDY